MIARWVGLPNKKKTTEGTQGFGVEIPAWLRNAPIIIDETPTVRDPWSKHTRKTYRSASSMLVFWIMLWAAVAGLMMLPSEDDGAAEIARIITQ